MISNSNPTFVFFCLVYFYFIYLFIVNKFESRYIAFLPLKKEFHDIELPHNCTRSLCRKLKMPNESSIVDSTFRTLPILFVILPDQAHLLLLVG